MQLWRLPSTIRCCSRTTESESSTPGCRVAKQFRFTRIAGPAAQYVVSFADFVRRNADGEVLVDSRAMELPRKGPLVLWSEPVPPHTLENVGDRTIHVIAIELKGTELP